MIRVYVAGPYSDSNVLNVLKNIGRGQMYANALLQLGFAPFCPWLDKEYVIGNWTHKWDVEAFYKYSIAWLEVSDCVFVVPDHHDMKRHKDSYGTRLEIERAKQLNIPVLYNFVDLLGYYDKELTPEMIEFKLSLLSFPNLKLK